MTCTLPTEPLTALQLQICLVFRPLEVSLAVARSLAILVLKIKARGTPRLDGNQSTSHPDHYINSTIPLPSPILTPPSVVQLSKPYLSNLNCFRGSCQRTSDQDCRPTKSIVY